MFYYVYTTFIVPATVLIPIYYGFTNYRNLPRAFKIILAFVIFSAFWNTLSTIVSRGFHHRNTGFFHIYTPFEFAFVVAFFAEFYKKSTRNIMLYVLIPAFAVFCVLNTVFWESMEQLDSNARSVDAVIQIACSMLFFAKNNNDLDSRWSDHASNWIVTGLLLYYSCSLFVFIYFNNLTKAGTMTDIVMYIYATILAIEYILFAVGIKKCKAQQAISISK